MWKWVLSDKAWMDQWNCFSAPGEGEVREGVENVNHAIMGKRVKNQ